jgi:hypothetical protein
VPDLVPWRPLGKYFHAKALRPKGSGRQPLLTSLIRKMGKAYRDGSAVLSGRVKLVGGLSVG